MKILIGIKDIIVMLIIVEILHLLSKEASVLFISKIIEEYKKHE